MKKLDIEKYVQECNKIIYNPCKLKISKVIIDNDNIDYFGCNFKLNNKKICFRKGKQTPTKIGHFVTFWKRVNNYPTPYDINDDDVDIYIVSINDNDKNKFGHFIFNKEILCEKKIISCENKTGKLGFRVYAPWYIVDNNTAKATQLWQNKYFIDINDTKIDNKKICKRFFI
jgi:hypothetical protein